MRLSVVLSKVLQGSLPDLCGAVPLIGQPIRGQIYTKEQNNMSDYEILMVMLTVVVIAVESMQLKH